MRTHYILDCKVSESHFFVANLLQLLRVSQSCRFTFRLRLRSRAHHLSRRENQGCRLRVTNTHDGCCKPLWFILNILTLKTDVIEVQLCIKKGCRHNILQFRHVVFVLHLRRNWSKSHVVVVLLVHLVVRHPMLWIWLKLILLWN